MAWNVRYTFLLQVHMLLSFLGLARVDLSLKPPSNVASSQLHVKRGQVREHNFTIARGFISPDGFNKSAILVNGQFPGPTIEADYGDTFRITVHNQITGPEEGTSIHWHGILQSGTPYYDGVSAITQCPIAPGRSMTYTFLADSYGSSFYHAHYSSQYIDGVFGPITIKGPSSAPYDIDLGPILLTDYFHATYYENLALIEGVPALLPNSSNNLINGKNFDSDISQAEVFQFYTGKVYKLRLMNAGAEGLQRFSIDSHTLTVVANDFVPIVPYDTEVITLGVGQRMDVHVKATGSPSDSVWMRSDISTLCAGTLQPHALAVIHYSEAQNSTIPASVGYSIDDTSCANDAAAKSIPYEPKMPPSSFASTTLNTTLGVNSTGNALFFVNGSSFKGDYNSPVLLNLANSSSASSLLSSPPSDLNILNYNNDAAMRLILINPSGASHPMHLHGHDFYILAEGFGEWNGKIINAQNPPRKDTHVLPNATSEGPAYLVVEIDADNPGAWAFHCHIAWHLSLGLYVNILDHPEALPNMPFPPEMEQTCEDWSTWTATHTVAEGDAGP